MLRARQQQQRSASSTKIWQQLRATPHYRQVVQGSAPLSKAEQEHRKHWRGQFLHWTHKDFSMREFFLQF